MARKRYTTGLVQEYYDEQTGELISQTLTTEVIEGYVDLKLPQKHKFNNGNFIVIFQKAILEIAKHRKLFTRTELDLFLYFLGTAGIKNSIYIDYPTLIKELGHDKSNVIKSVKALEKKGIIIRNSAYSRRKNESQLMEISINFDKINFDQLNYNLAYNGRIKEYKSVLHTHPPIEIQNSEKNDDRIKQLELDFENSIKNEIKTNDNNTNDNDNGTDENA